MTPTIALALVGLFVIHAVNLTVQYQYIIKRPEKHSNMIAASLRCDYVALGAMSVLGAVVAALEFGAMS
ncbi:TMhelix containing protein [Vibrio phage 1.244.A._10N.261.54.C3]|nr:TMhelix containing protein [Vibrio phage 1.244.A._10N.261.54.C3]AUR98733.1 TMhelix containing protein [Vibrio phage 1.255.O._10N.286.45.F1]